MKIRCFFLIFLFNIFSFHLLYGENSIIDSLRQEYKKTTHDSIRCDNYIEIGKAFELINPDSSIVYYNKCLEIAMQNDYKKLQSIVKRFIGNWFIDQRNTSSAMKYLREAEEVAKEINDLAELGRIYISIALVYNNMNDFENALLYSREAIKIAEEIDDKVTLSYSYNNIGLAYYNQYIYDEALKYFLLSCDLDEELGDMKGVAQGYINIGLIHYSLGNFDNTIDYYKRAIKISEELNEIIDMSIAYNNIAITYKYQKEYDMALEYLYKAVEIDKQLGDKGGVAICYINIGDVHSSQGRYVRAKNYFQESLQTWQELSDKSGMGTVLYYLSDLYIRIADVVKNNQDDFISNLEIALNYANESFYIAEKNNLISIKNSAANSLKEVYKRLGDFENAFKYSELYSETKDVLLSEEQIRSIADAEKKWEAEKKQLQIEHLEKEKEFQDLELIRKQEEGRLQRLIIMYISITLLVILILTVFILNRLRITRKQKSIIEMQKHIVDENLIRLNEKNEEIRAQNEEIEAQNNEIQAQRDVAIQHKDFIEKQNIAITDSINYAKRIQQALLPELVLLTESNNGVKGITDSFVFYKPKEIVSGDFYWANRVNDSLIIAVADCTGHGVPGGFMSMLGISFLNEIINKTEILDAKNIVHQLRDNVTKTLQQAGKKDKDDYLLMDGMNIAIVIIDLKKKELQYSGSFNPLFLVRNNELKVYTLDRHTIGIFIKKKKDFHNYHLQLKDGDMIYIFSDGFIDQFDEEGNERFKFFRFKDLLLSINELPLNEQKEKLEKTFQEWKGSNDQIDDVTILGFRV